MIVIMSEFFPALCGAVIAAIILAFLAVAMKEGVGSRKFSEDITKKADCSLEVNYLYALIPILPLFLLVIASKQVGWLPTKIFTVPCCMLIGTGVGLIVGVVNKLKAGDISKSSAAAAETPSVTLLCSSVPLRFCLRHEIHRSYRCSC